MLKTCAMLLALLFSSHLLAAEDGRRIIVPLDSHWLFQLVADETVAPEPQSWATITLPHTWNIADGTQVAKPFRRGVGYYQRRVSIPEAWRGRSIFVTVGAANAKAVISLNGTPICEHRTGFTAFTTDLTPHLRADPDHDLQISVDSRNNPEYPPLVSDYTFFGGIHRRVWLTSTNPVHVSLTDHSSSGAYLVQRQVSRERAEIEAQVVIANDFAYGISDAAVQVEIMTPEGVISASAVSEQMAIGARTSVRVAIPLTMDRPRLWDGRADPYCYRARVRILRGERITDEVVQPLGLRSFAVDPARGFILNGRPYDLYGPGLHQDHAGKGWAISDADRALDVSLLTEIGATCVRLVHYPHAPATLDLLDRAGIIVWSEIPIAYRLGKPPQFEANCQTMLTEMICQLYNHPSICFWGLFNELSGIRPEMPNLIQRLHTRAKELDPQRLTTGSVGALDHDPICDVTDVVAFNRYFGWFIPGANLMGPWAASAHQLHPQRCVGVAEYGGEGDTRRHADHRTRQNAVHIGKDSRMGTEEYQTQLHEELWHQMADKKFLWCKLSWNLADWATGGIKPPSLWPSDGMGRMGFVSNDRLERKDVFYWYKANWSKEPVLYIAERRFTPRQFREFDLRIYSNLGSPLAVTMNGEPVTVPSEIRGVRHIWNNLQAAPGKVVITVTAQIAGKTLTDTVEWELPDALPPPPARRPEAIPPKPEGKPDF